MTVMGWCSGVYIFDKHVPELAYLPPTATITKLPDGKLEVSIPPPPPCEPPKGEEERCPHCGGVL